MAGRYGLRSKSLNKPIRTPVKLGYMYRTLGRWKAIKGEKVAEVKTDERRKLRSCVWVLEGVRMKGNALYTSHTLDERAW